MPKDFKPGWEYIHSDTLQQEVALNMRTGKTYCEDKTVYGFREIEVMRDAKQEITPEIHLVKKIFEGEIVNVIHKENKIKNGELFDIF
jgi:hypothetical protein